MNSISEVIWSDRNVNNYISYCSLWCVTPIKNTKGSD